MVLPGRSAAAVDPPLAAHRSRCRDPRDVGCRSRITADHDRSGPAAGSERGHLPRHRHQPGRVGLPDPQHQRQALFTRTAAAGPWPRRPAQCGTGRPCPRFAERLEQVDRVPVQHPGSGRRRDPGDGSPRDLIGARARTRRRPLPLRPSLRTVIRHLGWRGLGRTLDVTRARAAVGRRHQAPEPG